VWYMIVEKELSEVSQTLLIPLVARAKEMAQSAPIIYDQKAAQFLDKVDTTHLIVEGGEIATLGILARTKVIDEEVLKLISNQSRTVIINLGVGLDTRFDRIRGASVKWYDIDLPEVINLRKQFIQEEKDIHFIGQSILDSSWVEEIEVSKDDSVIIIAEGLFMYFTESEVRQVLHLLTCTFPNAHIFFDVVHSFFVQKKISSTFLWGIDKAYEIEKMANGLQLIESWSMGNLLKTRQSILYRILNIFPSTRNRSQILHCQVQINHK